MAPILHCVRHAEGWHNLSEENMRTIHDPSLTPLGREQALALYDIFPNLDKIDMVVTSPLRRTIQTAFLGFDPMLREKNLKLLLIPDAQETSSKKADTGSKVWKLKREFGVDRIDTVNVPDNWNSKTGEWGTSSENIWQKAKDVREWVRRQDAKNLLLVTHGGFLHYLTETMDQAPSGEGSTDWVNTEYRSFKFTEDREAHLLETEESRDRRKEKPTTLSHCNHFVLPSQKPNYVAAMSSTVGNQTVYESGPNVLQISDFYVKAGILHPLAVGSIAVIFLFTYLRLGSNRCIAPINIFDWVINVALGSTLAGILNGNSLVRGLLALITMLGFQYITSTISTRYHEQFAWIFQSEPLVIAFRGKMLTGVMKKHRISPTDVKASLRQSRILNVCEVECAIIEPNGTISIFTTKDLEESEVEPDVLMSVRAYRDLCEKEAGEGRKRYVMEWNRDEERGEIGQSFADDDSK
ncbi:hypothetical protein VTL71DRAFT_502 [Oculimacula yallundae]|uniref:YetF C-terminal domain-containing protein n=1 Tax=Oculimacula yallundae TaxID=86028 RepID=A0ABR4D2K4_9HELO